MLNNCTFMGRLTSTPELRHTADKGVPLTSFCLAVDKDVAKTADREPNFLDFVAWRNEAEFICKHFTRGQSIIVVGSLQTRGYKDSGGSPRKAIEVVVDTAYFAGGKAAPHEAAPPPTEPTPYLESAGEA